MNDLSAYLIVAAAAASTAFLIFQIVRTAYRGYKFKKAMQKVVAYIGGDKTTTNREEFLKILALMQNQLKERVK